MIDVPNYTTITASETVVTLSKFFFLLKTFISRSLKTVTILHAINFARTYKMFTHGPGDLGSIPGRVIPKTQKMVLDAALPNTQKYKVRIKG